MKKKVAYVGPKDSSMGFQLAGVDKVISPGDLNPTADDFADYIYLVEGESFKSLSAVIESLRKRAFIQEIPKIEGGYDGISRIIKDTLGFDLRR